jgi:hypothetical protein
MKKHPSKKSKKSLALRPQNSVKSCRGGLILVAMQDKRPFVDEAQ